MSTPRAAPLKAATYLGDNTLPIIGDLVAYLSEVTGIEVVVGHTAGMSSAEARHHAPNQDIAWMCGCLAASLIASGRMSHKIVAAPIFAGSASPVYHSVVVTRADGPPSLHAALYSTLAINEFESWSGYIGLKAHIEDTFPGRWFADQRVTGSHRASISAVADRTCDVASIDMTVWEHMASTEPETLADLRIVDRTPDSPTPPFSLGSSLDTGRRNRLIAALHAIGPSDISSLDGVVPAGFHLYRAMMLGRSGRGGSLAE